MTEKRAEEFLKKFGLERDETRTHVLEVRKRAQKDAIAAAKNILKQLEHAKVNSVDVAPQKYES